MVKEKFKTFRPSLRKLAGEVGYDPDSLTHTQLETLEKLASGHDNKVRIRERALRTRAVEMNLDPDTVTMSDLAKVVQAEREAQKTLTERTTS